MLRLVCLLVFFMPHVRLFASYEGPTGTVEEDEDTSLAPFSEEEEREELAFTQDEIYAKLEKAYAFDLGPVMPWNRYGLGLLWKAGSALDTLHIGLGDFQI